MEQLEAVQRMQDYIAQHITENITPADLARAALFSPWHAYRLFCAYVGMTPAKYIRRLRLSQSAMQLKHTKAKIVDVAFEMGFGSADGYTRAFAREFGMTPVEYARHPVPITLFIPYRVQSNHKKENTAMESVRNIFIQVIHKPARKVIIKRGIAATDYFDYCTEVGCDVWGLLMSMDSLCGEPVCLWLPDAYRTPGTSQYVQGVEAAMQYNGDIPDGFDSITLPAADYLLFQGEPFEEADYEAAIAAVMQAADRYDPAVIGYAWDTDNPRIQLEPRGERGYMELRAVKKV